VLRGKKVTQKNREGTITECHPGTKCNRNGHDGNDAKSHWRTQLGVNGKAKVRDREHPALKTASGRPSSEERSWGEEEVPTVQAKTEAHPIGLINGLEGKLTTGRAMHLRPRSDIEASTIIASALIGFAVLVLLLFGVAEVARRRREKKTDSTRLLRVFRYLHDFNVDDLDIQLSAAGGFHVGYLNELAEGINTKEESDKKTDTSSDDGENGNGLSKKV